MRVTFEYAGWDEKRKAERIAVALSELYPDIAVEVQRLVSEGAWEGEE